MAMALAAAVTVTGPAQAVLDSFRPVDEPSPPGHGFPVWYTATDGMSLELCLDVNAVNAVLPLNQLCLLDPAELANPLDPVSFPDNFWPEIFYTRVDSDLPISTFIDPVTQQPVGGSTLLVMALEGAFSSVTGDASVGENITFARIRVRIDNPIEGANFKVTHPYGVVTFTNIPQGARAVNFTEDIGIPAVLPPPTDFSGALLGPIGPFLRWTAPDFPVLDQNGNTYIGDPAIPHSVTGSPFNTNFYRIEGPVGIFSGVSALCADPALGDDPVDLTDCIETDLFLASGKLVNDIDQDGIVDTADNCPATANPGQEDADGDGAGDVCDNCTLVANGPLAPDAGGNSQLDTDGDGFGNICDADLDNNGLVAGADALTFRGLIGQAGVSSAADFNGDTAVTGADALIFRALIGLPPGPACCATP